MPAVMRSFTCRSGAGAPFGAVPIVNVVGVHNNNCRCCNHSATARMSRSLTTKATKEVRAKEKETKSAQQHSTGTATATEEDHLDIKEREKESVSTDSVEHKSDTKSRERKSSAAASAEKQSHEKEKKKEAEQTRLWYFNRRGRAEPARLMFAEAGVTYSDKRFEKADWPALKKTMPFGQVPVLEMPGIRLAQSSAIHKYLATKFNMYGSSAEENALIDSVAEAVSELRYKQVMAHRENKLDHFHADVLAEWVPYFEGILAKSKSSFYVGDRLTYADLVSFNAFHTITARYPTALSKYPRVAAHTHAIGQRPRIAAWLKDRPITPE